jgi:hypothetical protein
MVRVIDVQLLDLRWCDVTESGLGKIVGRHTVKAQTCECVHSVRLDGDDMLMNT